MSNFIVADRQTDYLLPPSVDDWLNQDHLARFIVEVIDQLDLSKLTRQYAGRGSKAYHPATLLAILVYGYATGVFSSRRLEQATYDSVAFRFLAANRHPDHDSLAAFRRRFLDELSDLFLQVLEMAKEMKVLKVGNICLDGTKIEANASRHSALSHGYIEKLEVQLKGEIQELLALAEQADRADIPNGVSLPEELKRREDRLAAMAAAKATIVARAKERDQREKAEYDEKMACRAAKEKATGKKPGGKPPRAPEPGPRDKDQLNLTDEESRILPVAGGGFEQAYNAQAAADAATMLIVATGVTQAPNDKQQVEPMLATLKAQAVVLGAVECLIADSGYCSEKNIKACEAAGIDPLIAVARDEHHPGWRERHSEPAALPDNAPPRAGHVSSSEDPGRTGALCVTQADHRTGVRDHQVGDGLSPLLAARFEQGHRRVDVGLYGVEFEAPGRIAPAVGKMRGKPSEKPENRRNSAFLLRMVKRAGQAGGQSDRLLATNRLFGWSR